ncbi:hypothetical protein CICLE_v10023224mg [Citrus x clementina]|uniref:Uncharacterized protein n=1 Tax=Citrus clementina TaxID=85681 RepID=V4TIQ1_CITCL|nr:hypothetical protein CICLE_v10023224mg [Citrus x clementina]
MVYFLKIYYFQFSMFFFKNLFRLFKLIFSILNGKLAMMRSCYCEFPLTIQIVVAMVRWHAFWQQWDY